MSIFLATAQAQRNRLNSPDVDGNVLADKAITSPSILTSAQYSRFVGDCKSLVIRSTQAWSSCSLKTSFRLNIREECWICLKLGRGSPASRWVGESGVINWGCLASSSDNSCLSESAAGSDIIDLSKT